MKEKHVFYVTEQYFCLQLKRKSMHPKRTSWILESGEERGKQGKVGGGVCVWGGGGWGWGEGGLGEKGP